MNTQKLKGLRVELGLTQKEAGDMIEKSTDSYAKKERGEVELTLDETKLLTIGFGMDFDQFNAIFYNGDLPFGKESVS